MGEQPAEAAHEVTPEEQSRAVGNHLQDAADVLRKALAADDALGSVTALVGSTGHGEGTAR